MGQVPHLEFITIEDHYRGHLPDQSVECLSAIPLRGAPKPQPGGVGTNLGIDAFKMSLTRPFERDFAMFLSNRLRLANAEHQSESP